MNKKETAQIIATLKEYYPKDFASTDLVTKVEAWYLVLKDYDFIYHKKSGRKKNEYVWVCSNYPKCDAYVGCHEGTTLPLGRPANARLRTLKAEAHKQFDPIWKSGLMNRREA